MVKFIFFPSSLTNGTIAGNRVNEFPVLFYDCRMLAATKAVEAGVSGIVVSNHGARQLDYAPATISVLEEVLLTA